MAVGDNYGDFPGLGLLGPCGLIIRSNNTFPWLLESVRAGHITINIISVLTARAILLPLNILTYLVL